MLFTSSAFLLFLAVLLALYSLTPQKYRWLVLLAGSMAFYGLAEPLFLLYICSTIAITYICTMLISGAWLRRDKKLLEMMSNVGDLANADDRSGGTRRAGITSYRDAPADGDKELRRQVRGTAKAVCKRWMLLCLFLILGILSVVKYTDFTVSNVNSMLSFFGSSKRFGIFGIIVPMGISFYTFQAVGYVVDVYREKAKIERNPLKLALFISFFPQVVQGPISRFGELSKTLYSGDPLTRSGAARGAHRILWGFFKKLVIADRLWPALSFLTANSDSYQGVYYLFTIALYAVVLYCDFSGGIDIAIGVAEMFGVRLPENFNRPFYSKSIQEYWQRWHMTMYGWFRDYVFYPMAASKKMLKFSKACRKPFGNSFAKRLPVHISLVFVWFLTGLWHGAAWNFIVWGLINGFVLMVSLEFAPLYARFNARFPSLSKNLLWRCFQILRTFWLMNLIRSFDIYAGVSNTFKMIGTVTSNFSLDKFIGEGISNLTLPISDYISAGAGLLIVFFVSYLGRGESDYRDRLLKIKWPLRYVAAGLVFFMTLIMGAWGHGFDARQFIYNMF
ncbi:MAG: MBOAT family protein [Oscillospiraceae bacterium]|nr:MBOAT family protein [Oscillospiraceae bacterium]